jgi:Circadian oscillating protein COP23
MPIDPKKFKKVITNHFENLTEEEFLKTLHKSSPHLFDDDLAGEESISLSSHKEIKNKTDKKILLIPANIFLKYIGISCGIVITLLLGFLFNNSSDVKLSAAPVFTSRNKFRCQVNENDVLLNIEISDVNRPLFKFVSKSENKGYSSINRCIYVSNKLAKYTKENPIYITTGTKNGQSILCVSRKVGEGCIKDEDNGAILTLGYSVDDPHKYLRFLIEQSMSTKNGNFGILVQSEDGAYIGKI